MRKIYLTSKIYQKLNRPNHSWVGAFRAESTDQWTASSGITTKIRPLIDGPTSWFKYEELIDEWQGLTKLEFDEHGPALKNRLVGDAAMYKGLLERETLRSEDPTSPKELRVFPAGFFFTKFIRARRETLRL